MNTKVNKFVKKKRRKKTIKKVILGLFIIIIGTIIFIYKAPIFNLKKINISGLVTLSSESLEEELKYNIGQNIFTIDYKKIENILKGNPYIKEIKISKKSINQININVVENKIAYFLSSNGKITTINNEGIVVEETYDIGDRSLTKLTGIDISDKKIGDKISEDNKVVFVLETFYKMIEVIPEEFKISEINLYDFNNIICHIGDVEIILGDSSKLLDKMNVALNILEQKIVTKGYIDMSFEETPIIKQND